MCGYIYDEEKEGVNWEDLPSDYKCPLCQASFGAFSKLEENEQPN